MISAILFAAFIAGIRIAHANDNCEELWYQCRNIANDFFSSSVAVQLQQAFDCGQTDIDVNDQIRDSCGFLNRSAQCTKTVVDDCMPPYGPAADWGRLLIEQCGDLDFPVYMAVALRCNKKTNILGVIGEVYGEMISALSSTEPVPEDLPCRFLRLVFRRVSTLSVRQQCGQTDTFYLAGFVNLAVDVFGCSQSEFPPDRIFDIFHNSGASQLKNNRAG